MNELQCLLFGVAWLFAALLMGRLIQVAGRSNHTNHKTGLLLILFSFVCGITMLGIIIASVN